MYTFLDWRDAQKYVHVYTYVLNVVHKHVLTTVNSYLCGTLAMCNLQNAYYFFISASNVVVCQHENHLINFKKAFDNEMLLMEQIYMNIGSYFHSIPLFQTTHLTVAV